jgi:hypothetical protein
MYQLTVEPFTYPVHRREADTRLFKEHGRIKADGPLSASDLALVSLALTSEAQKPVGTAEQIVTRDATPKVTNGVSVFGWRVRDRTSNKIEV